MRYNRGMTSRANAKQTALLCLLIILAPFVSHATINVPTNFLSLNQGLVGWWTLDGNQTNWTTGITNDSSGNGNSGQMMAFSTSTSPVVGKIGQALNFDGAANYIDAGAGSSLAVTASGTLAAWVTTPDQGKSYSVAIGNQDYDSDIYGYNLGISGGHVYAELSSDVAVNNITSDAQYLDAKWHHIALTWDGSTISLYVDGALAATPVTESIGAVVNLYHTLIGSSNGHDGNVNPIYDYKGTIDDARIYNRTLSAAEIVKLYNTTIGNHVSTSLAGPDGLSRGLVGWWTLDGKDTKWDTGVTNDMSGNGNNGALIGMSTTTSIVEGKIGQAVSLSGDPSVYVGGGNPASLNLVNTGTISAWVKYTSTTFGCIFANEDLWNGVGGYGMCVDEDDSNTGTIGILIDQGGAYEGVNSAPHNDNKWHLVTATFDGSFIRIYVDGKSDATPVTQVSTSLSTNSYGFKIGRNANDQGPSFGAFTGLIDDVRIYNRALSAAEISKLYNTTAGSKIQASLPGPNSVSSGPAGWWTFDGDKTNWNTGVTQDSSGSGNNGQMISMSTSTSPVEGRTGQALSFDGASQHITAPEPSTVTTSLSLAAWIYWQDSSANSVVVYNGNMSSNGYGFLIGNDIGSSGNYLGVILGGVSWSETGSGGTHYVLPHNAWTHVVATWNGSTWCLYANGSLYHCDGTSAPGTPSYSPSSQAMQFAAQANGTNPFHGYLDDVRIYNRGLSATEIKQLYNLGR